MILVDIGNTNVTLAFVRNKKFIKIVTVPTNKLSQTFFKKITRSYKDEQLILCSVVPKITTLFKKRFPNLQIVGGNLKVPINCFYDKKKVGPDRLVAAYGAKCLFPSVRFVIDFGTAITLDFLSKKGDYLGGIILPGVGSTLMALSRCAMLPKRLGIKETKELIPTNTNSSINKGIQEGFSLMINSLIKKYKKKLNILASEKIVLTGGEAKTIIKKLDFSFAYEPLLVLRGLKMLAEYYSIIQG